MMQPLVSVIIENRLALILTCFLIGLIGMILVMRHRRHSRWWKIADLIWVALGGLGVITALLAGAYADDNARLQRLIDLGYATSREFDHDAARFRLRYCRAPAPDIAALCEKIEFLSASTAINADLPLFADVARSTAPLRALRPLIGDPADADPMGYDDKLARVRDFNADLLTFDPLDAATVSALLRAEMTRPDIAADYRVLATTYQDLTGNLHRIKAHWEFLQRNSLFVLFQVLALSLIAIAAPFRLGKSLVDLR